MPREVSENSLARLLEAGHVEPQVPVGRQALGDLDRDAEGGVELEDVGPRDRVGAGRLGLAERVVEHPQAVLEVPEELLLLLADDRLDADDALLQLGIGSLHGLGHGRHQGRQDRLATPHLVGVEHRAAEQPADHVALLLGAGADVLVDAEGQRPRVIGQPPDADAVGMVGPVRDAQLVGRGGDDRPEDVGVEDRRDPLQAGRRAFQAHAGVDVLLGQGFEPARPDPVELREDQVPDLHLFRPVAVVEDLGAGAADAVGAVRRRPRRPEVVVLAHPGDPVGGELDLVMPDRVRLVVVEVDRHRQPVGGNLEDLAQELPGPVDRLALEVVAEAEVAQHLEERLVERGLADVLDVAGAQAFLAGGGAREARVAQAHELALELVHPGGREEHRRVVGHEDVAGTADASLGGEEIEVRFAKVVCGHGGVVRGCGRVPGRAVGRSIPGEGDALPRPSRAGACLISRRPYPGRW